MAIKESQVNFRVEIEIPEPQFSTRTVQQSWDKARELCATIRRRLDADERGTVREMADTERVCEFCGRPWTEDSLLFNGGCCRMDVNTEDARQAANAA